MEALRAAEDRAAAALINFAKSDRTAPTGEEVKAVEEAMSLAGCNDTSTTRAELRRVEVAVMEIAGR